MHSTINLYNKLNEIKNIENFDEVKKIIISLAEINLFKHSIETNLEDDIFYERILVQLNNKFNIKDFKIIHINKGKENILHKQGNLESEEKYFFCYTISRNIQIKFFIYNVILSDYQSLCLNTYFSEISNILHLQFTFIRLNKIIDIDPLTKLQNRTSFNIEMKTLIPLAIREQMKLGVLLINIDRFRAINDEYGVEFGDKFLKLYAKTIKDNIRNSDIAVRFSGGEFLVVLINVDTEERVLLLAEKLQDKLAETYLSAPNHDHFKKTVSIGIAIFPKDSHDIDEVIRYSEMALADAQNLGRNNCFRYENIHSGTIELF